MEIEVLAIEIAAEPIELCKLLKIANLVGGGGEAKMVIAEGYVYLNGEVEFQKRKKIYFEDIVQFNGEAIMPIQAEVPNFSEVSSPNNASTENSSISLNTIDNKANKQNSAKKSNNKTAKNKTAKKKLNKEKPANKQNAKTGRKSISF